MVFVYMPRHWNLYVYATLKELGSDAKKYENNIICQLVKKDSRKKWFPGTIAMRKPLTNCPANLTLPFIYIQKGLP